MKLSVVMSVLDGEAYVEAAARSVLEQTFTNFRFIVVNNGSTDRTPEILDRLAAEDARLKVIHQQATGTYVEGRSEGISQTRTEWVALMDADDLCHPRRLEKQMACIERSPDLGALGTWGRYINEQGKVTGYVRTPLATVEAFNRAYRRREPLVLLDPSAVLHRPTFDAVGGYRAEAAPAADLDLWYRLAEAGRKVLALPEALLDYRIHASSESVSKTMLQRRKTHFINYNMRRRRDGQPELTWEEFEQRVWRKLGYRLPRLRRDLGFSHFKQAGLHFGQGKLARCAVSLTLAGAVNPSLVAKRVLAQLGSRWRRRP